MWVQVPASTNIHMVSSRPAVKSEHVNIAYRAGTFTQAAAVRSLELPAVSCLVAHDACSMHDSGELFALRTNCCRVTTIEPGTLPKHFAFIVEYRIWCNVTKCQEPRARQQRTRPSKATLKLYPYYFTSKNKVLLFWSKRTI